jgi:hypothetical protein
MGVGTKREPEFPVNYALAATALRILFGTGLITISPAKSDLMGENGYPFLRQVLNAGQGFGRCCNSPVAYALSFGRYCVLNLSGQRQS